jgi:hypothetical protein
MTKNFNCLAVLLIVFVNAFSQSHMYEITNCNGETRTALYGQQLSNVMWCLKGDVKFRESIILKYSNNNNINIDSLEGKATLFRKLLPKNYWINGVGVTRLDTKPNEDGRIWFERVYVEEDGKGIIKVFAACKVIFDGTDPEIERVAPKIQEISIVLDKAALKKYSGIIKKLMVANNIKQAAPEKNKKISNKDEKPPEVEKLEN